MLSPFARLVTDIRQNTEPFFYNRPHICVYLQRQPHGILKRPSFPLVTYFSSLICQIFAEKSFFAEKFMGDKKTPHAISCGAKNRRTIFLYTSWLIHLTTKVTSILSHSCKGTSFFLRGLAMRFCHTPGCHRH